MFEAESRKRRGRNVRAKMRDPVPVVQKFVRLEYSGTPEGFDRVTWRRRAKIRIFLPAED